MRYLLDNRLSLSTPKHVLWTVPRAARAHRARPKIVVKKAVTRKKPDKKIVVVTKGKYVFFVCRGLALLRHLDPSAVCTRAAKAGAFKFKASGGQSKKNSKVSIRGLAKKKPVRSTAKASSKVKVKAGTQKRAAGRAATAKTKRQQAAAKKRGLNAQVHAAMDSHARLGYN